MSNEFNFESLLVRAEVAGVIETLDKDHPVLIYNPNPKQRNLIMDLILKNLEIKDDKMSSNLNGYDMVMKLIPELTNIPLKFDENNPEDVVRVKKIIEDPSDLFLDVNTKINKIVNQQFYRYYENIKEMVKMPQELRDAYLESLNTIVQENKIELVEDAKSREIEELEAKLKALKEGK